MNTKHSNRCAHQYGSPRYTTQAKVVPLPAGKKGAPYRVVLETLDKEATPPVLCRSGVLAEVGKQGDADRLAEQWTLIADLKASYRHERAESGSELDPSVGYAHFTAAAAPLGASRDQVERAVRKFQQTGAQVALDEFDGILLYASPESEPLLREADSDLQVTLYPLPVMDPLLRHVDKSLDELKAEKAWHQYSIQAGNETQVQIAARRSALGELERAIRAVTNPSRDNGITELKIARLKRAYERADLDYEAACGSDINVSSAEERYQMARDAYYSELEAAQALRAVYEAMGDINQVGAANAGDTYDCETHGGDIRFSSTEYWQCAIDTYQVTLDCDGASQRVEP